MAIFSLIIPIYNEEKTLLDVVENCAKLQNETYFINNNIKLELLLVDDCSSDNSFKIAKELDKKYENVIVFSHKKNEGKGAALKTGFLEAKGDFIAIQDADKEYNPFDYIKLLKLMIEKNASVVYGSRYLDKNNLKKYNLFHTLMNNFLTCYSNLFTGLHLTDMETCYKLFKKEIIKKLAPKLKEKRFGFEPEITSYLAQEKCKIYESAILYNPRNYNEGKKIKPKDGFRALYCIMHYGAPDASFALQLIIYTIIGGLSALVNIALFMHLIKISSNLFLNVATAFIAGAVVNYVLCILILFRHKARWTAFGEIVAYVVTLVIMGFLDYFVTKGLLFFGLNNFLSKSLSSLVGFGGNFLFRKYFVFKATKNNQKEQLK